MNEAILFLCSGKTIDYHIMKSIKVIAFFVFPYLVESCEKEA